jgi:hypothetical protein
MWHCQLAQAQRAQLAITCMHTKPVKKTDRFSSLQLNTLQQSAEHLNVIEQPANKVPKMYFPCQSLPASYNILLTQISTVGQGTHTMPVGSEPPWQIWQLSVLSLLLSSASSNTPPRETHSKLYAGVSGISGAYSHSANPNGALVALHDRSTDLLGQNVCSLVCGALVISFNYLEFDKFTNKHVLDVNVFVSSC